MRESLAICTGVEDLKLPALFFDKIEALFCDGVPESILFNPKDDFIKREFTAEDDFVKMANKYYDKFIEKKESVKFHYSKENTSEEIQFYNKHFGKIRDYLIEEFVKKDFMAKVCNSYMYEIKKQCDKKGIVSVVFYQSNNTFDGYGAHGSEKYLDLSISNIPVIDTNNLTWEKILELRRDSDFTKKIRDFRTFYADNYKDKDRNFIIDDVNKKIDEYKMICKKNELEFKHGITRQILHSKSLLSVSVLTFYGAMIGDPFLLPALFAGINNQELFTEVSDICLTLRGKQLSSEYECQSNELAYLVQLQEKDILV